MNIQTKFDIGDEVQFQENGLTHTAVVWEHTIHTTKAGSHESYYLATSTGRMVTKSANQLSKP